MTPRSQSGTRGPDAQAAVDPIRDAALRVLVRVDRDAAYANRVLDEVAASMSPRDAAFCTAVALGTLRRRAQLDWLLDRLLRKDMASTQPIVQQILRLGAFQILHMDVRQAAAVDEAVKLAKRHASPGAANMVNAVLRRMDRAAGFAALGELDVRRSVNWSRLTGVPPWYAATVHDVWPGELGAYICGTATSEPPLTIRINAARTEVTTLQSAFRDEGIGAFPHPLVPGVLTVYCPAPVLARSAPFQAGLCHVQDGAAVLAALALEAQPGEQVADLCAAPGGKAAILATQVGEGGRVVAVEKQPRRADMVRRLAERQQLPQLHVAEGDATTLLDVLPPAAFDRVLVDAPCSALGIARHRPDLLWRDPPDLGRDVVPTQRALLSAGLRLLRPGAVCVYSTCTFTPEEGPALMHTVLADFPEITPYSLPSVLDRWTHDSWHAIIPPGDGGLDGFTIIRLRRRP